MTATWLQLRRALTAFAQQNAPFSLLIPRKKTDNPGRRRENRLDIVVWTCTLLLYRYKGPTP